MLEALRQTNADFRQTVWLPTEARGAVTAVRQSDAQVSAAAFANQKITFQTEAPAASLVVVAQTWYPAWRAYVDGRPVKLWRANYAFQALEVPAGKHRVELSYRDPAFLIGLGLSGLGVFGCLGIWFGTRFPAAHPFK